MKNAIQRTQTLMSHVLAAGMLLSASVSAQGSPEQTSRCEDLLDLRNLTLTRAEIAENPEDGSDYCYVRGIISPAIHFHAQLPLPAYWNGRFLQWGDGVMAMIIMVIVGLPMYICATASTPVAASLLFAGISPGAALVFMLTGPATNLATMGVIREQLGLKSLGAYLIAVIGTAVTAGLLLNAAYDAFAWPLQLSMAEHSDSYPLWRQLAAMVLVGLIARVWVQPLFLNRGKLDQSAEPQAIEQS